MPRTRGLFHKYRNGKESLVETGFHYGGGITQAMHEGYHYYSGCEPYFEAFKKVAHERSMGKFKDLRSCELLNCNSEVMLECIPLQKGEIAGHVFWIDSHYSGKGTYDCGYDPLYRELTIINKRFRGTDSMILIDDCRGKEVQLQTDLMKMFGNVKWEPDEYSPTDIAVVRI